MSVVGPWFSILASDADSSAPLSAICGMRVTYIEYFVPWLMRDDRWQYPGFDVVPGAVVISTESVPIGLIWRNEGPSLEGIEIAIGKLEVAEMLKFGYLEAADSGWVSPEIQSLRGQRITATYWALQDLESETPVDENMQGLWAVSFGFGSHRVSIALGTVPDPGSDAPEYQPDSLVVIYDADVAGFYQPRLARQPASGALLRRLPPD